MTTLNDTERQFAEQLLLAVKNREFTVTYGKLAERVVPPANSRNVGRNIENISILCHVLGLPLLSAMVVILFSIKITTFNPTSTGDAFD